MLQIVICVILIISVDLTESKSKFGKKQYANLQRTALLYMKGAFYARLTCPCLYLIPRGGKYPHKYRGCNYGWTQEQGTLFLCGDDRFSLDWVCLAAVAGVFIVYAANLNVCVRVRELLYSAS